MLTRKTAKISKRPAFKLQTVFLLTSCQKCTRRLRVGVWVSVTSFAAGGVGVLNTNSWETMCGVAYVCWSRRETCKLTVFGGVSGPLQCSSQEWYRAGQVYVLRVEGGCTYYRNGCTGRQVCQTASTRPDPARPGQTQPASVADHPEPVTDPD